ncbi:MAG: site-specific integrase [Rhodospirillales bacterium]
MATTKSYTDLETFQNDRVIIYRRSSSASLNFHTRIRLPGVKGYLIKSCKTPDRDDAYRFAMDLYENMRMKVLAGETINAPNASKIIDEFLKTQRAKSPNRYKDINQTIGKHFRSYSQGQTLEWIDSKSMTGYFDWRRQKSRYGRPTSENTLHSEAGEILRFLRWCKDMKYLREVPTFQKPSHKDIRRPHFTRTDWNKLIRYARHWINSTGHPSVARDRTLLWNYVLILANSGIRVGEARTLCWKDIRIEPNSSETEPVIVFFVSGKTGGREVVARNAEVLEYLQRIKELYAEPSPDDFVFAHKDGKPIKSFKKSFASLIDTAGVGLDGKGNRRTIYSLRHTYATFRLEEGVGVYTLARNMGTSVTMIERFYGQTRTPDQAVELTKMRSRKRQFGTILDVLER